MEAPLTVWTFLRLAAGLLVSFYAIREINEVYKRGRIDGYDEGYVEGFFEAVELRAKSKELKKKDVHREPTGSD